MKILSIWLFISNIFNGVKLEVYEIQRNTALTTIEQLINNYTTDNKITCLSLCNLNDFCLSVLFKQYQTKEPNCFIFSKYFDSNQKTQSTIFDLYEKNCNEITTGTLTTCISKETNLFQMFQAYQLHKSIRINDLHGFGQFIENGKTIFYYQLSRYDSNINIYNESWILINNSTLFNQPTYMIQKEDFIYITSNNYLYRTNKYLNETISINRGGATYRGLYYNSINDHLLVLPSLSYRVDIYDINLNLIKNFSTLYQPYNIEYHDNKLYIGANQGNGTILVYSNTNYTLLNIIQTICKQTISSIKIDYSGYMALVCKEQNVAYLYHINRTYLNYSISTSHNPMNINVDSKGRLIINTLTFSFIYY